MTKLIFQYFSVTLQCHMMILQKSFYAEETFFIIIINV